MVNTFTLQIISVSFAVPVEGVFIFGSEKVHMRLVLQLENEVLVDTIGLRRKKSGSSLLELLPRLK